MELSDRKVTLWGDDPVYRWSRGILGSNVLGSAYLALDDWLARQAASGRPVQELVERVLQNHGLIGTTAPLIAILIDQINTPSAIDSAGPFLALPRLWDYDIHRHVDDMGIAHRIGFFSGDDVHYLAVERIHQRYAAHAPLSHALLLPFRLKATPQAQDAFDRVCARWCEADLCEFEEDLDNPEALTAREERIARRRSDADPSQIVVEKAEGGIRVSIAPPKESETAIKAMQEAEQLSSAAIGLSNWVQRSREQGLVAPAFSIEAAIERAKALELALAESDNPHAGVARLMGGAAVVGTAAVAARYGSSEVLAAHSQWIETRLLDAAAIGQEREDVFEEAILPYDMQVLAAWGLAGLANREKRSAAIDAAVATLAVHRIHAVSTAAIEGLDWSQRPDFVRSVHIAALDACVIDVGSWWKGDREREAAAKRSKRLRVRAAARALRGRRRWREPILPPAPDAMRWVWTGKWPWFVRRLLMPAKRALDWGKAEELLKRIDWVQLTDQGAYRTQISTYLVGLVAWTRAYSETNGRRNRQFPYKLGHALARSMGRFAFFHGGHDEWRALLTFTYHDRAEGLLGDYLDGVAHALMQSGNAPDDRFWSAWQPAADWLLQHAVPSQRDSYDRLSEAARAAGLVGPYMTPIPPDWPHLEWVLRAVDRWVRATGHLPAAAYDVLAIVERMNTEQRIRWFLPWLELWIRANNADGTFWSYNGLGNKAAALLKPLASGNEEVMTKGRQALAVMADGGATVARQLIASFASKRQN